MSSIFCPCTDPTTVEHSVSAFFVSRNEQNLIVAKKNLLQIYRLVQREEDLTSAVVEKEVEDHIQSTGNDDDFIGTGMAIRSSERQIVSKLILVTDYRLYGTIISLCTIRSKSFDVTGLEHLLIGFEPARASLLRWNQDNETITTVSLHSFERDEYESHLRRPSTGKMRIDPLSRVATLSLHGDHLAFLPIQQRDELQIEDPNDDDEAKEGPISKSFVLGATQLEEDITQIIDFTFVDGYREPAIAILYSTEGTTTSLLNTWRKDTSKLVVLTLDIQAGARTAIFEINDLPSNLISICMIPDPIGGCLLLGANELIYVDPASRVVALAVNSFARGSSNMAMRDYAHLDLRLEGSLLVPLQDGSSLDGVLLILADGNLGLLTLNLDGRTISSLHLKIVSIEFGGDVLSAGASCVTVLEGKRIFVGCRLGNSKLLAWRRKARAATGLASGDQILQDAVLDVKDEETDQNDVLDDLYGDDITEKKLFGAETTTFDLRFYTHDTMLNQGPITGLAVGTLSVSSVDDDLDGRGGRSEIAVVGGSGRAGNMTIYRRSILPDEIGKFESPDWQALWTVKVKSSTTELDARADDAYDTFLMASKSAETQVFTIDTSFVEKTDSEFERSDPTVAVGTLMGQTCIVQICADVMRTYDAGLKLLELKPTPEGSAIVSASIVDPYVLLLLDNGEIALYSGNQRTKELEEIDHKVNQAKNVSATLFTPKDSHAALFQLLRRQDPPSKKRKRDQADKQTNEQLEGCLCFSVTSTGALLVHQLPSLREVFRSNPLAHCPEILTHDSDTPHTNGHSGSFARKVHVTMNIVEIVVAELGEFVRSPYLVLRTLENDIITYRPFINAMGDICFAKLIPAGVLTRQVLDESASKEDGRVHPPEMVVCDNLGGYACLFIKKGCFWLLKTDQSLPTLHAAGHQAVLSLSGFNTLDAPNGYIYCDEESVVRICRLPNGFEMSNQWSRKPITIGRSVHAVAYYAPEQVYAVLTSQEALFELPDDDDEEWQPRQEEREKLPRLARGAIELIDARSHKIIDRYDLAENEQGLCLKSVVLTIATEYTKKKRACLAVSTGILRGEDLAMRGAVYVFDVVEVVPEHGQPDFKYRLKIVSREEVRAAATTLCEVDGYLLSSQGQKVVVRSLEEDERLTPVAFVDLGLATTTAKCLRSMILFGDIQKGIRFVGFGEEPYKMTSFGRDYEYMDVVEAEFMVDGATLYFVASDPQGNVRVLQYDPENPTTLAGTKLVRRADMHVGHALSSMVLIGAPTSGAEHTNVDKSLVLCAASDGSIGAIFPISERSYRRLYTVQAQLASTESQIAGLNPRAYRLCTVDGLTSNAAKGMLDGQLLSSFRSLDAASQSALAQKSGIGVENVLTDLSKLGHMLSGL